MRKFLLLALVLPGLAMAQPRPGNRAAEIDAMIGALKLATTEELAGQIEGRIRQLWAQSASPTALLLMNRGMRELNSNASEEALDDFEAALTLDPALPDAFHRRALARFTLGDYAGALADIQETLTREPRHFPALQSLSRIAEERQDFKGALSAWQKALELSPKTPNGEDRLKTLTRKAFGVGA